MDEGIERMHTYLFEPRDRGVRDSILLDLRKDVL